MADKNAKTENDLILFASNASRLLLDQRVDEAVNICESGVREFPFYAPGHYVLGLCYNSLGKMNDAKNEFERVLVYDPSHNTAMRKLSEIYTSNGLEQVANELLLKEALYSPLNSEIINILKEKDLYKNLNPVKEIDDDEEEYSEPVREDVQSTNDDFEEAETGVEPDIYADELEADKVEDIKGTEVSELEPEPISVENSSNDEVQQIDEDIPSDESDSKFDNLDPLSGVEDSEKTEIEEEFSTGNISETTEPSKEEEEQLEINDNKSEKARANYFNVDEEEEMDENEWLEVENLLIDEEYKDLKPSEVDPYSSVLPQSEMLRNDTELLLEELKSSESNTDDTDQNEFEKGDDENLSDDDELNLSPQIATNDSPSNESPGFEDKSPYQDSDELEQYGNEESDVTISDLMENPNLVTPTFGEILIAQHKFSEARHVFLELQKREPENVRFTKKISFLDKFLKAQNPA